MVSHQISDHLCSWPWAEVPLNIYKKLRIGVRSVISINISSIIWHADTYAIQFIPDD